jgi:tRNA dimethylallyltransferase
MASRAVSTNAANRVLFVLGPTASGKTALACELFDRYPNRFHLVSVDSALVYREMNIGTAKPDAATLARYPHALIDLIAPTEAYSAADFRRDALREIHNAHAIQKTPLLVGGTMMYVKALTEGLSALPVADATVRAELEARAAEKGWPAMHDELRAVDPATAARLAPNDSQRIQRALEVYALTGTPISVLQTRCANLKDDVFPFAATTIALMPNSLSDRAVLHERIATRFDAMLAAGFIDEVRGLRARYALAPEMPSMRCVGYRQAWEFLDGAIDRNALRETGIAATRQLAKRQMTWLRSMPRAVQVDCLAKDVVERVAAEIDAAVR